ncbi:hypothetical protein [Yersinia aldovae]|uniref:Lipoprotein n=1 Tax=Yersinia aldovae TaxID=29483 RepID=A0ABP1YTE7_YERAL|nr:hypothetical protein [Yersinia aldovae]CNJ88588.1 Uncharacterised protein [Yersinia aldovae]CNL14155.1 Uncharacterised protein [Yersinia aldovae]
MKIFPVVLAFLAVSLTGCDNKPEDRVDAECYFSSTKSTAIHYMDGSATEFAFDFNGNKMSGWAWVQRVNDAVSDATCHLVK